MEANLQRYEEFIGEIRDKFIHSFNVLISMYLKRQKEQLKNEFQNTDYSNAKFCFILVIKGHKKEWLMPLMESLNREMIYQKQIWKATVVVLNDEEARENGLII